MHRKAGRATPSEFAGPLVGRDDELLRALELLDEAQGRLVTITGRGGIGKTRLAVEVARKLDEGRADTAVFVPLATVSDSALVIHQVATTLGVFEVPGISILDTVADELTGREQVLVLDNFEHVAAAATDLQHLLAACADLRLLVTAQAPLRLRAERVLRLSGLREEAAIALYCDRAAAVDADFRLTEESAADVEALCRELEGLPLAIELAAARAASMTAAAVLTRLERHRLDLLKADYRDVPERHRALRAAISWTHQLLDDDAQRLLRCLTVTGGSFDLDDAEALAKDQAFDAVGALVDLHLVDPRSEASSTSYRIPDSIREFAAEQLIASEEEDAAATWLHSVAARARKVAIAVDTSDEPSARRWLMAHQDELAAALTRCLDREDTAPALDLMSALVAHWTVVAKPSAFRELLHRAIDAATSAELDANACAETLADASVVLRWEAGTSSLRCLERAEALATSGAGTRVRLHVLAARALSCAATGDFERSGDAAFEGLAQAEQVGAQRWIGRFQVWAGMIDHMRGNHPEAVRRGLLGLAHARRTNDERMIVEASMLLMPLKPLLPNRGDELPPADDLVELTRRTGRVTLLMGLLPIVAMDALAARDLATATGWCHESLRTLRRYRSSPISVFSLMCAARIAYTVEQPERVAYFHGVVRRDIAPMASLMPPQFVTYHERMVAKVEQELGAPAFDIAAARGENAGRLAGIDDALAWTDHLAHTAPGRPRERRDLPGRRNIGALSPRQTDVLVLIAAGLTNKEIADRLGITRRTAEHHTEVIFRKLAVRGRTEATAWAHRNGLVPS